MLKNGIQTVLTITVCPIIIRKQNLTHENLRTNVSVHPIFIVGTHRGTSLQNCNDIFQFAVDTFKIRHHIFIFTKSLVLLPRVFINIGINVLVCIRVLGIIYSTTIPSEIFCIIVEYL